MRPEIATFVYHPGPKIVSDKSAPLLARQLALHANVSFISFLIYYYFCLLIFFLKFTFSWLQMSIKVCRRRIPMLPIGWKDYVVSND